MHRIQFAEFELDLELFVLKRKSIPIEIGQRPLDLLVYLIQNRERIVDLDTLRRDVWNSAALSPAAIPTCIGELRKVLDDDASSPKYIECTRGRGYRFSLRITNFKPDHTSSTAQTLMSTMPSGRA